MSLNIREDDLRREGSLIGEKIGFDKGRQNGIIEGTHQGSRQKHLKPHA